MGATEVRADPELKYEGILAAKYVLNAKLLSSELAKVFSGEKFAVEVSCPVR